MIPVKLELHNFLAYRDPDPLNLEGIHVACISGENGAGKSSLLDAITWALWGKARSASADDLIHQNLRETRVALEFEMAGARHLVIRQRSIEKKTAQSLLEFQVWDPETNAWRGLSEPTMRATQDRIDRLLRLDYDTFLNSALLSQGRADEFTAKPPFQRVQILAAILGLDVWERYEDRVKEKIRRSREQIDRIESRRAEMERELARREEYELQLSEAGKKAEAEGKSLAELERAWSAVEQRRAARADLERLAEETAKRRLAAERELAEARADLESLARGADAAALERRTAEIRAEREALALRQSEREKIQTQIRELSGLMGTVRGENDALAPQTEPLKKRLEALETATAPECPTCGQPLTPAHRKRVIEELLREIESRRGKYKSNAARLKDLAAELDALQKDSAALQTALLNLPALERRLAEAEAAWKAAKDSQARLPAAQERVARWRKTHLEEDASLNQLRKQLGGAGEGLTETEALRGRLGQARLAKRLADERVGGARQTLAALEEIARRREAEGMELEGLRRALSIQEELRDAFGKRGVPTMVIETVVPELELEANRLLAEMSNGQMRLRMETRRETKAGDARDTLELQISDELGTRAYEMYSGGEAFRINFAVRIALSKLLARRAGAQLRALFIDEGFGTQDAAGRERLVAAIQSVQNDFDRILVITHLDELRDSFPARIEVTKTPSGSNVRVA
ncbi:MAG: SMC family ATPase [Anaerolineales bacterium]|nr:SMC family ATPase [Anaerolineales bacterium]